MTKIQVDTMPDQSEVVYYDTPGIPLYIRKRDLSDYPGKKAPCHWHDDIELTLILDGKMNYYVNGENIELTCGNGILINSREMHYGYSVPNADCRFLCILFHPSLLASSKQVFRNYVEPLITQKTFSYLYLSRQERGEILDQILKIWQIKESREPFYELNVIGELYPLWQSVSKIGAHGIPAPDGKLSTDLTALRQMVSFIHSHFQEDLSLQTIADQANVCKSKCCKIFKNQVSQSPIDFLNCYRLHVSADMLKHTSMPVSDIALECGFHHLSYYSKLFSRYYGCTPREYRKIQKC